MTPTLKRVLDAKARRRKYLAKLSIVEKLKMLEEMKRNMEPILRNRGTNSKN